MLKKLLALLLVAGCLSGCTTTPGTGRSRLVSLPHPVKDAAAAVRIHLAGPTQINLDTALPSELSPFAFQLQATYGRLAEAVAAVYGDVPLHGVDILDNEAVACLVDPNDRRILVYRGLSQLGLAEDQVALLLAREIARLVADHHGEQSSGALLAGVLILLINPMASLANLLPSTVASTATAAGSVPLSRYALSAGVSVASGQAVETIIDLEHEQEADLIAMELMKWTGHDLERATESQGFENASHSAWVRNHLDAQLRIRALMPQPPKEAAEPEVGLRPATDLNIQ